MTKYVFLINPKIPHFPTSLPFRSVPFRDAPSLPCNLEREGEYAHCRATGFVVPVPQTLIWARE